MTHNEVLQIVEDLGYKFVCPDDHPNGSKYDKYSDSNGIDIWVGNAFIESEISPVAFALLASTSASELIEFLHYELK